MARDLRRGRRCSLVDKLVVVGWDRRPARFGAGGTGGAIDWAKGGVMLPLVEG